MWLNKPVARRSSASKGSAPSGRWLGWGFLLFLLLAAGLTFLVMRERRTSKPPARSHPVAAQLQTETQPVIPLPPPPPVEPAPRTNETAAPPPIVVPPPLPLPPKTNAPTALETITNPPTGFPRPVRDGFEAQVALARAVISPGSIDGAVGGQTRAALAAFQRRQGLPETGTLDAGTRSALNLDEPPLTDYTVTAEDVGRLQPVGKTWLEKSRQSALDYETILELVSERSHANPLLVRKLNPAVDWERAGIGTVVRVPNVVYPAPEEQAAWVEIHLARKCLEAFGTESNLLAHFPCSIAAKVEKRPVGELHVTVVIPHPNYTFDPAVFTESPEAQAVGHKLVIPPGPNNPVGVAWIGLDRPGYGMHGTPIPEQVGRTESHGCFRLANWDAEYLLKLAWVGMPVRVMPD